MTVRSRSFRIALVAVVAVALLVRLGYLHGQRDTAYADERTLVRDVAYYDMRAREIAAGELVGDWAAFISPLQCYFLGGVYAVTGGGIAAGKIAQAILGALSCLLMALIGRRLLSAGAGILGGAMLALYGPHVYYTGLLLPAVLVLFLNLLVLYLAALAQARPSHLRWLVLGGALGLAVLAKANALLLLPALLLWLVVVFADRCWRLRLVWCALLLAGAAITIAPVTWRNHAASGEFVLVGTTGGINLLKGNGPHANGTHVLVGPTQATTVGRYLRRAVDAEAAVEEDRRLLREACGYALSRPLRTARLAATKLALLFDARELGIRDQLEFVTGRVPLLRYLLSFGWVMPPGLAGLFFAWRHARGSRLIHVVLAGQAVSLMVVFVLARYRLTAVACCMLFAAWVVLRWIGQARSRQWRALALGAGLLVAAAAFVQLPVPGFTSRTALADQYMFIGAYHHERGELPEAVASYEAALREDWQFAPNTPALLFRLADALVRSGRPRDAQTAYTRLLELLEEDPSPEARRESARVRLLLEQLRARP